MKRSRRVILTMMGSTTVAAISMGFVPERYCRPGFERTVTIGPDGRSIGTCRPIAVGGFGHFPRSFHGHGHAHGGG